VLTAIVVERADVDDPPIGVDTPRNRTAAIDAGSREHQRRIGRNGPSNARGCARRIEDVEQTGIHRSRPFVGGPGVNKVT